MRRFVNGRGLVIFVKQNEQNSVKPLFYVDGTQALSEVTTIRDTPTFDLKSEIFVITRFRSVVTSLSGGSEFNTENARRLIFGNLPGYPQWLTGEGAISLSQFLCLSQDFKH